MTFTDYLLDSLLVLLVFRQVREARLDRMAVLLPLGIAAIVGNSYLHSDPDRRQRPAADRRLRRRRRRRSA